MPLYSILVPTRTEWQKKRDAAAVPKGAAKVSIGDSIDPVHKTFGLKTTELNLKHTDKLLTNLAAYRSAIEKKHPKFVPEVDKILKRTRDHKKVMEDIDRAAKGYNKAIRGVEAVFIHGRQNKWAGGLKLLGTQFQTAKGFLDAMGLIDDGWEKLGKEAGGWMNKCENLKTAPSDSDVNGMQAFIDKCSV